MNRRDFLKLLSGAAVGLAFGIEPVFAKSGAWHELVRPSMGTYLAIAVYSENANPALKIIEDAFQHSDKILNIISEWNADSVLSRGLSRRRIVQDPHLIKMLTIADNVKQLSRGKFNICSRNLNTAWKIAREQNTLPDKQDILRYLQDAKRGYKLTGSAVEFSPQAAIDSGGIGKGFVVQSIADYLTSRSCEYFRIKASGDMYLGGATQYLIQIKHPLSDQVFASFTRTGPIAVSTSGPSETRWTINGIDYHHLIDPLTGDSGRACQQVTVIHHDAAFADALATGLFFHAPQNALQIINSIPGCLGCIVDNNYNVHASHDLRILS